MQATSQPRPIAGPLMAEISGTSRLYSDRTITWILSRYPPRTSYGLPPNAPERSFIAFTSPPAENARPAPVSTAQRIDASSTISLHTAATAGPSPACPSAFIMSGRFSVMIAMGPRFSRRRIDMSFVPDCFALSAVLAGRGRFVHRSLKGIRPGSGISCG